MEAKRFHDIDGKSHPLGKVAPAFLKSLLGRVTPRNGRVRIGPRFGDDASAIDFGDRFLVCAGDPITLASSRIGAHAVMINANDVAVMGARPSWYWAVFLIPEAMNNATLIDEIFNDTRKACDSLGMSLCGGHSEITEGIARPIVCGFAAGEVSKNGLVDKKHIAPGDDIILCRGIAIEGTALIAREHVDKLTGIDKNVVKRAEKFMEEPGICVVREALAAAGIADVHGMHDPTEGGILAGLHELTTIASVGAEIDDDAITVFPETDIICRELSLDPKGLLASGALLIVADETDTDTILRRYKEMDVPARVIGSVKEKSFGIKLKKGNEHNDIPPLSRDEITRIFQAR